MMATLNSDTCLPLLQQTLSALSSLDANTHDRVEFELALNNLMARLEFSGHPQALQISMATLCERAGFLLFEALGYYALLQPDPALTGNEPLPYAEERALLATLRQLELPDTHLLKNQFETVAE